MDPWLVGVAILTLIGLCSTSAALKIQVFYKNGEVLYTGTDNNADFYDRSYQVPTSPIQGILVYAIPKNACQSVQPAPDLNGTKVFAFIEEYTTCSGQSELNLQTANYSAMIAFSSRNYASLEKQGSIAQALFLDSDLKSYLEDNAITNDTSDLNPNTTVYVSIQDDSALKLELLFYIFGAIILAALLISIFVFCCSICWRVLVVKWRTRGLSRWQIRRLPKKKYRRSKDGACETCSICLEEFKEGEAVRILPCDHVFHPKCVDVWLQKWNRTCPLCKSTIKRRGKPLFSGDPESSRLLSESGGATPSNHPTDGDDEIDGGTRGGQAPAIGASNYGAVEHSSPLRLVTATGHRRSTSGVSSSSSQGGQYRHSSRSSKLGSSKREPTTSVTTIELNITSSGETSRSTSGSPSPLTSPREFHTPRQSDDDDAAEEGGGASGGDDNKELTPSFRTAIGENGSMSSSVRV